MGNWSELQHDMVVLVVSRIEKLEDFVHFGAVCRSWHKATRKENFRGLRLWQQIPCLMLAVEGEKDADREFYSLIEKEIVAKVSLPNYEAKKCIASLGWFLSFGKDRTLSLFNPFSFPCNAIQLPHQNTFPDYGDDSFSLDRHPYPYLFVHKMALSTRPSQNSDFAVMVIYGEFANLGFWRMGDEKWSKIETRLSAYADVTFYNGQFYALDRQGFVIVCNLAGLTPTEGRILLRVFNNEPWALTHTGKLDPYSAINVGRLRFYLVQSSEALLVITRDDGQDFIDEINRWLYDTKEFRVYEVDLLSLTWKEIKSIGSRAIFVGHSATTIIDTSHLPGIKASHIYFTDDCWHEYAFTEEGGGKAMGMYNLETGIINHFYPKGQLLSTICPSVWITPCF